MENEKLINNFNALDKSVKGASIYYYHYFCLISNFLQSF